MRPIYTRTERKYQRDEIVFPNALPSHKPRLIQGDHDNYDLKSFNIDQSNNGIKIIEQFNNNIKKKRDQQPFQRTGEMAFNNYYLTNFNTINSGDNGDDINKYMSNYPMNARNPVDASRDKLEKSRMNDTTIFKEIQGGNIAVYNDNKPRSTRIENKERYQNRYVSIPRNSAVPMDKI